MKTFLFIIIFFLINAINPTNTFGEDGSSSTIDLPNSPNRDSLIIEVVSGWMNYLKVTTSASCFPINETNEQELEASVFSSDYFVPAQLGYKIMVEILSFEARKRYPDFTAGLTRDELIASLSCMLDSLKILLEEHAYEHPGTGKKALYQVHRTDGTAPLSSAFEKTVSMLDNVYLIVALELVASWGTSLDSGIAEKAEFLLNEFDTSMWIGESNQLYLGSAAGPLHGEPLDRILSEGRLAPVLALARGEITLGSFQDMINNLRWNSISGNSLSGIPIKRLPFFGTALEIWVPTAIVSVELETVLGCESLHPLVYAWEEARRSIPSLPAAGFSGIGDGFGGFLDLSTSPAESTINSQAAPLLVVPAAFMQAGAMIGSNKQAQCNFLQTYNALKEASLLHPKWGAPNYIDYGSGLVNTTNYLRGTLEIAQASVALLNALLGGNFLEEALRQNSNWTYALNTYRTQLGSWIFEKQAEQPFFSTGGQLIYRTSALENQSWYLSEPGDNASYEMIIPSTGNYRLILRYSNDDLGTGDSLTIKISGDEVARIQTADTGDGGSGWENFIYSEEIDLGLLSAGKDTLSIILEKTDGYGVELDLVVIKSNDTRSCDDDLQNIDFEMDCDIMVSTETPQDKWEAEFLIYPNPSSGVITIEYPPTLNGILQVNFFAITGQLQKKLDVKTSERSTNKIHFNLLDLPPGLYFLTVSDRKNSRSFKVILN